MKLLLTLPYCTKDYSLAAKLLDWMAELQPQYLNFAALMVADHEVSQDDKLSLQNKAKHCFEHVETMVVRVPPDKQKWPDGPNIMFASAARQVQEVYKCPWLWFEPDAAPLKDGWLETIWKDYNNSPKRFMGSLVPSDGQPNVPPIHLAGCAVYPQDAWTGMEKLLKESNRAWDMVTAPYTVPRATHCARMQHYWGLNDMAPTFTLNSTVLDKKNVLGLDFLHPDAVTFHRCKDGSLIDCLLRRKSAVKQAFVVGSHK